MGNALAFVRVLTSPRRPTQYRLDRGRGHSDHKSDHRSQAKHKEALPISNSAKRASQFAKYVLISLRAWAGWIALSVEISATGRDTWGFVCTRGIRVGGVRESAT